ncbi:MAG: hypothetical protein DKT66_15200 [Candidatus Melainabacteria bacterium]|nr:MAG: hypothetical protein DKT66_15200 [Candidatus Melainabacteria bacterium]
MSSSSDTPFQTLPSRDDQPSDEKTYFAPSLSFLTYSYRETLFAEFERLVEAAKQFDGLIIDLMQTGFSVPLDELVKFSLYAKRLLKPQGVLLFVKADGAITLTKDDPGGGLTFNVYDSPFGIFARHPMLADYVCATVSGIDRRRLRGGGSTLANHILYTSTPVLTDAGRKAKEGFNLPAPQSWVLQMIDDYSSVEAITRTLEERHHLPADETLRMLQELEAEDIIFPVFSRIQFLSNCYHNRKPFRLGRYMVAAGILSESQLQELLERQEEEGWGKGQKTFLGLLAVRLGFLNTRELEVLLDDQYLYGGYHKKADSEGQSGRNVETMRDSMIGSLGAIEAHGLLQSLSTAQKTGLLTVENRDKALVVSFTNGKPIAAKMNRLKGIEAITEFVTSWTEGIFVFRDKGTSQELEETCELNRSLDRMLLDSMLYKDQVNQILAQLPTGRNTILERVWNFETLWNKLSTKPLKYLDESTVSDRDKQAIQQLANLIDGLSTLDEVIKSFDMWPGYAIIKSVHLLIEHRLVNVQQASLFRPLSVFQRIVSELQKTIGRDDNKALLQASLHYVHGDSPAASRFHIDHEGRVSVNLAQVKTSGTPVSAVLLELRRWMEAYLAYCRRQIDPHIVDNAVAKIVNGQPPQ